MIRLYYVYILTNIKNSVFYIGITSEIENRVYQHKSKSIQGFTSKYNTNKLVYFENTDDVNAAICREKQLKNWHREWKISLIRQRNPDYLDLSLHNYIFPKKNDPEISSG